MTYTRKQTILEKLAALKKVERRPSSLQRAAYRLTKTQPYASASASLRRGERKLQRRIAKSDFVARSGANVRKVTSIPRQVGDEYRGWKNRVDRGLDESAKIREEIKKSRETAEGLKKRMDKGGLLGKLF